MRVGCLCPGGLCQGGSLSQNLPIMVEARAVRILLECILVYLVHQTYLQTDFSNDLDHNTSNRKLK